SERGGEPLCDDVRYGSGDIGSRLEHRVRRDPVQDVEERLAARGTLLSVLLSDVSDLIVEVPIESWHARIVGEPAKDVVVPFDFQSVLERRDDPRWIHLVGF